MASSSTFCGRVHGLPAGTAVGDGLGASSPAGPVVLASGFAVARRRGSLRGYRAGTDRVPTSNLGGVSELEVAVLVLPGGSWSSGVAMRVASVVVVTTIPLEAAHPERISAETTHAHGLQGTARQVRLAEKGCGPAH